MTLIRIAVFVGLAMNWTAARAEVSCGAAARHVVGQRWDAVLGRGWERVADCAHPERPARMEVAAGGIAGRAVIVATSRAPATLPIVVHAGDAVHLWQQAERVRIEMTGVAEQAARLGDRVVVRMSRSSDDEGLRVERISGIVRGAGDVEMER